MILSLRLPFIYSLFAVVATMVNIGVQEISLHMYLGCYSLPVSVGTGTMAGLVVKYVLDKRYIFCFQPVDAVQDTRTFLLYSVMGVITTGIFWGFEFGFYYLFMSKEMRYLGGVLGLAVGYLSKYHLDKRFVFNRRSAL